VETVVVADSVVVMAMVDEVAVLVVSETVAVLVVVAVVVAMVVAVVVAVGVPVTMADITALQSTDWYLGCVLWSIRPSRGRR